MKIKLINKEGINIAMLFLYGSNSFVWNLFMMLNVSLFLVSFCVVLINRGKYHLLFLMLHQEPWRYPAKCFLSGNACTGCNVARKLDLGNACCCSVQNLLSSHLLSKNFKIKIYRNIILPVVLYGCEIWSVIDWRCLSIGCWGEYLDLRGRINGHLKKTA
jgi:hypothetical protein